jgi:hypothetical protein
MLVCLSKKIQQKVPIYQTFASKILTKKNKGIVSNTWLLWSGPNIAKIEIEIFLNREVRIISYHSIGRDY